MQSGDQCMTGEANGQCGHEGSWGGGGLPHPPLLPPSPYPCRIAGAITRGTEREGKARGAEQLLVSGGGDAKGREESP